MQLQQDYAVIARAVVANASLTLCEALMRAIVPAAGDVVLDLGAGSCVDAELIARTSSATVVCVDRSAHMLGLAPSGVRRVLADVRRLPFPDAAADAAYAVNLLQILDNPQDFLREVRRVLRPGAVLALPVTSPAQAASRFVNRFFPSLGASERSRYIAPKALERLLRAAGFSRTGSSSMDLGNTRMDAAIVRRLRCGLISGLAYIPESERRSGLEAFERFVQGCEASGQWHFEHRTRTLVVAEAGPC
jgi:ubiquinone/menaquinone biosynthesis C-methylase UbiE